MRKKHGVSRHNQGGIGKVVTGLVIGSVVGAAMSLLMAPASGEETRRKLIGDVKDIQNKARNAAENVEEKGREIVNETKSSLENVKGSITERITRRPKSVSN